MYVSTFDSSWDCFNNWWLKLSHAKSSCEQFESITFSKKANVRCVSELWSMRTLTLISKLLHVLFTHPIFKYNWRIILTKKYLERCKQPWSSKLENKNLCLSFYFLSCKFQANEFEHLKPLAKIFLQKHLGWCLARFTFLSRFFKAAFFRWWLY